MTAIFMEENMKNLKKHLYNRYEKYKSLIIAIYTMLITFIIKSNIVYAESNTGSIDSFITFICDWLTKIGGVVALVGGFMFCAGWLRDDADGKYRGLTVVMAGFMMVALAKTPGIFGL